MIAFLSFQETKAMLERIRATMQVCTMVSGNNAPSASGQALEAELGSFVLLDPQAEHVLLALHVVCDLYSLAAWPTLPRVAAD